MRIYIGVHQEVRGRTPKSNNYPISFSFSKSLHTPLHIGFSKSLLLIKHWKKSTKYNFIDDWIDIAVFQLDPYSVQVVPNLQVVFC